MTLAYWCVLAAALMPYLFTGVAKFGSKPYDNRAPREFLASLEGHQKRANWAQMNSFEAFPPFAAAVIIAHLVQAPQTAINSLALVFVLLRLGYGWAYITDCPKPQQAAQVGAVFCVIGLFLVAARAT